MLIMLALISSKSHIIWYKIPILIAFPRLLSSTLLIKNHWDFHKKLHYYSVHSSYIECCTKHLPALMGLNNCLALTRYFFLFCLNPEEWELCASRDIDILQQVGHQIISRCKCCCSIRLNHFANRDSAAYELKSRFFFERSR